ncbi:hypothetical protein ARSEF4850_009112 [Beauveria asiatica]
MATPSNFVKTSIIILSDTHGMTLEGRVPEQAADVCIHAGDFTEESRLDEFYSAITLLRTIKAPLKLVIAGNHDFTLDTPLFRNKIEAVQPPLEPELVNEFYGEYEQAKQLLINAKEHGIYLLNEGTHDFELQNGARLRVYASPYTPSLGDWGFQYHPDQGHDFGIENDTNIVITHGPPRGILDRTNSQQRAGCPDLFAAVAEAKPQIHCFGHIHEGWGAKMVAWRSKMSQRPSFLTDIDNSASHLIEQLSTLHENKFDGPEEVLQKKQKHESYISQKHCFAEFTESDVGKTLFVNAAIKGGDLDADLQLPWVVDIMLPQASSATKTTTATAAATEEGPQNEENQFINPTRKRALEDDGQDARDLNMVQRRKISAIK